jgi:hypothetical protein
VIVSSPSFSTPSSVSSRLRRNSTMLWSGSSERLANRKRDESCSTSGCDSFTLPFFDKGRSSPNLRVHVCVCVGGGGGDVKLNFRVASCLARAAMAVRTEESERGGTHCTTTAHTLSSRRIAAECALERSACVRAAPSTSPASCWRVILVRSSDVSPYTRRRIWWFWKW